jgi:hypothetical protein
MPGLKDWNPYETHVQGGLREGNFLNGQFVLICAGPPHLADLGGTAAAGDAANSEGNDVVFPIGLTQNIALSQNKAVSRMFEIGSERSYFITGRTIGQLSLSRVMYHGPSLLRCLYAYYNTSESGGGTPIDSLFVSEGASASTNFPFTQQEGDSLPESNSSQVNLKSGLHGVKIPPGFDNVFMNLASDLFSQPIGLLLVFRDNEENNVASVYLEQCYVPTHSMALDSQGLIIQESVGIQYERLIPIQGTSVKLVDKIIADPVGLGYPV